DHTFHPLRVSRVVEETPDARSFVLEVPQSLAGAFAYRAGQFVTHRVWIDGAPHLRCYSMSSSPDVDSEFQVTVKRVEGGLVSNWIVDNLRPDDTIETTCPAGVFCLPPGDGDVAMFAGGSGITPVISIAKTALATTSRRVHLLYANRDRDSIIFDETIDRLLARYPDRLTVTHHLDVEHGFVDGHTVRPFAGIDAEYFLCGPAPFMDVVEGTLLDNGVEAARIHVERFTPAGQPQPQPEPEAEPPTAAGRRVTIELAGRTDTVDHHPGTTILQTARQMGMVPPYSCESGSCATCMAKLVEGEVSMFVNNALEDDEIEEGWILTCQSVPTTPSVHVVYEEG
ncbi:MAG TPA: ferredoxin--NADP reductase, partial [Mycobacteriales bacterium]|nr:ferredoxin--NADP reductase [Mycobacteriales bacterium]